MRVVARLGAGGLAVAITLAAQTVSPALLGGLQWRSIGPAATGGRIADIAVAKAPGEPLAIFAATTSGGLFKSVNEGVSWIPVFDRAGGMMSLGAVAVAHSNPAIVWVGTGEADNRQSSSWGDGVYRSLDGGATWRKMGLDETRHVGKIVIHPTDPNTVYVAAVGHLWGSNAERGVYKTTDGGMTWSKVLYKDENTGAIDLAMDPKDPNVIFAAMYQRQRKGWGYNGGGPGSGLYRTTDGGAHWTELRKGLPDVEKGRIGLCIFPEDRRIVYAIVEADPPTGGRGGRGGGAGGEAAAGAQLGGVFRSTDGGETWEHMSGLNPRPCYYSRIYVDPKDPTRVYLLGSNRGFYVSADSGRSFRDVFSNVHGEDHALWINPENTNHLVIGGDGGVSISYDHGLTWLFRLNLPIGQFEPADRAVL
ncbi:Glycosyl hydrolase (fragment) [Candidatus Sulfopaludibacter sp. SbA3]